MVFMVRHDVLWVFDYLSVFQLPCGCMLSALRPKE